MYSGEPSSTTSTARRPAQKAETSAGTSGKVTLSTCSGSALAPAASARPSCCSARTSALYSPPCTTMPTSARVPAKVSFRPWAVM